MAKKIADAPASHPRRHDPGRRERIVAACLDVIAERGVAGASHRVIAAAAEVPLGSMTYHFKGMDDLLHCAFTAYSQTVSARFEARMRDVPDRAAAIEAVISLITDDVYASPRDLVLSHELYTLAARNVSFRSITNAWMAASRSALELHFDPIEARIVDAMIEGFSMHRALDNVPLDASVHDIAYVRFALGRVLNRSE